MQRGLVVVALVLAARVGAARADDAATLFAHFFQRDVGDVSDIRSFSLVGVKAYSDVVVGRFPTSAGHYQHGAVLLTCDARQCNGRRVWLATDGTLDVVGVVDLAGGELALTTRAVGRGGGEFTPLARLDAGHGRLRFPALVVASRHTEQATTQARSGQVTGTAHRDALELISLRASEAEAPEIFQGRLDDRGPSGAGTTTDYRLVRDGKRRPLAIIATAQWHLEDRSRCRPPPPVESRFTWHDGRFAQAELPMMPGGCR